MPAPGESAVSPGPGVAWPGAAPVPHGIPAMARPTWEVVGGAERGGVLVRGGVAFDSPRLDERLSTGAHVEDRRRLRIAMTFPHPPRGSLRKGRFATKRGFVLCLGSWGRVTCYCSEHFH